jgi:predicted nucleic acid-binding Zn ribbon protein
MEHVKDILRRFLEQDSLRGPLAGWRAMEDWPAIVGPDVARRTRAVALRDQVLLVEVSSSVWMNQLTFLKPEILIRLREAAGPGVVADIQFVMAWREEPGPRGSSPGDSSRGARDESVRSEDSPDRTRPGRG